MSTALNELKKLLNQPGWSKSEMINFMSQIRILIEENNFQSKYKFLNLYCNWTFHSKISGSMVCYRILEKLTDILLQHHSVNNSIIHEVSNVISIPNLRQNFIDFLNELNLPVAIFEDNNTWRNIFGMIASNLLDRPLEFPEMKVILKEPKIKRIYDSIQNKSKGTDLAVKKFSFVTLDMINKRKYSMVSVGQKEYLAKNPTKSDIMSEKNLLYWQIEISKDFVYIVSPLVLL